MPTSPSHDPRYHRRRRRRRRRPIPFIGAPRGTGADFVGEIALL